MKKVQLLAVGLALFAATLWGAVATPAVHAATSQAVWTGLAGDNQFNTPGNWQSGSVPSGDVELVFDCVLPAPDDYTSVELTNNATGFTVSAITTTNAGSHDRCTGTSVDSLPLAQDVVLNGLGTAGHWLTIKAVNPTEINSLVDNGSQAAFRSYTVHPVEMSVGSYTSSSSICDQVGARFVDNTTIEAGAMLWAFDRGDIIVKSQGTVSLLAYSNITLADSITFEDGSFIGEGVDRLCSAIAYPTTDLVTVTLSGDIELGGDVTFDLPAHYTVKVTGALSGPGRFVAAPTNESTFIIESSNNTSESENGTITESKRTTREVADSKPEEHLTVAGNETIVLSGERAGILVSKGGVLKGTGKVTGGVTVHGVIAPGLSPGTLTIGGLLHIQTDGVYDFELLDIDNYDKIVARYVTLEGELSISMLPGASVTKGQQFTIIDNTGDDPITGTFTGLAEGAEVNIGDAVFSISYIGGTGNDVVLTALNDTAVPSVPNTGVQMLAQNALVVAVAGLVAVGSVVWLIRRQS